MCALLDEEQSGSGPPDCPCCLNASLIPGSGWAGSLQDKTCLQRSKAKQRYESVDATLLRIIPCSSTAYTVNSQYVLTRMKCPFLQIG